MVEGARLESVYTGNSIEGSNPSPSANRVPKKGCEFSRPFLCFGGAYASLNWQEAVANYRAARVDQPSACKIFLQMAFGRRLRI